MNDLIQRIIAQPIPAAFIATGLVLFAICATLPARRVWRWWRGRKVKLGAMTMLDFAKAEKVYFDAFMAPDDTWNAIKAIAAGYAASGSKPDESGRPVTRREFLDDRDEIDDCFVDHESRIGGLESRIAALEAAQKPAQPEDAYEPRGTLPVVGDIIVRVAGADTVAEGRIVGEVWWETPKHSPRVVVETDGGVYSIRAIDADPRSAMWAVDDSNMADGVWRILKRQKPAQPGVWIDGAWWRGWEDAPTLWLRKDGIECALTTRNALSWIKAVDLIWDATRFEQSSFTELPESDVRAMHAEAKKQGVV